MNFKKCPYCGEKISYFTLLHEKSHGEHFCPSCRKESKIFIMKKSIIFFVFATVIAVLIAAMMIIFDGVENLWTILLVAAPYIVFFLITPFFVILRPYRKYKEWMTMHTGVFKVEKEEAEKNKNKKE